MGTKHNFELFNKLTKRNVLVKLLSQQVNPKQKVVHDCNSSEIQYTATSLLAALHD